MHPPIAPSAHIIIIIVPEVVVVPSPSVVHHPIVIIVIIIASLSSHLHILWPHSTVIVTVVVHHVRIVVAHVRTNPHSPRDHIRTHTPIKRSLLLLTRETYTRRSHPQQTLSDARITIHLLLWHHSRIHIPKHSLLVVVLLLLLEHDCQFGKHKTGIIPHIAHWVHIQWRTTTANHSSHTQTHRLDHSLVVHHNAQLLQDVHQHRTLLVHLHQLKGAWPNTRRQLLVEPLQLTGKHRQLLPDKDLVLRPQIRVPGRLLQDDLNVQASWRHWSTRRLNGAGNFLPPSGIHAWVHSDWCTCSGISSRSLRVLTVSSRFVTVFWLVDHLQAKDALQSRVLGVGGRYPPADLFKVGLGDVPFKDLEGERKCYY